MRNSFASRNSIERASSWPATRAGLPVFLLVLLTACFDDSVPHWDAGVNPRDGGASTRYDAGTVSRDAGVRGPVAESDPGVVSTFQAWERECVGWLRSDCKKAQSCDIRPASDCWSNDHVLRGKCREMAAESNCNSPSPRSFTSCRERTEQKTCQEYCSSTFCFNFCFFTCLD